MKIVIRERIVKQKIAKLLRCNGVFYFMPQSGIYGKAGIADFVCCVDGRFLAIEAKGSNGKQTELQKQNELAVKKANGTYLLIDDKNISQLEKFIVG